MWRKAKSKKRVFDSIKDHNWEEILTHKWSIEIYTIFWNNTKKLWKIKNNNI